MFKQSFFFLALIGLILSCKPKMKYHWILEADKSSQLLVRLDPTTPPDTKMMQFFEGGDKHQYFKKFAMLNYESQTINIHENTGIKVSEVKLLEIDSTLSKTSGFYFINSDSLLIYSESRREMRLISCSKKFQPQLLFNLDSLESPGIRKLEIQVNSATPIIYKKGLIFLTGKAMLNNDISTPQAKSINTAISFNVHTKKTDFISMFSNAWEERYWHNEQYYLNHICVPTQNVIIYSLNMKDSLILYNIQNKSQIKKSVSSDELGKDDEMIPDKIEDPSTIGTRADLMKYLEKPHYGQLIYDNFRNVYYRFVTKGFKKRISYIIICDSKLNKIGESELPSNYLPGSGFFLGRNGLFLRKADVSGESKIVYTLFKLTRST